MCVSVAFANAVETSSSFSGYVSLSLFSSNNAWSSRPVRALIAPALCTEILLGLPFLVRNKIVIDHADRTAIDKTCGYDLLNETLVTRPTFNRILSPKE